MAKVLIVHHSQSGNTERLARSVARGVAGTEGTLAAFKHASGVTAQDIRDCDAIVICSPGYFSYMAGVIKDLFDRTYDEVKDDPGMYKKPLCIIIGSGNDGSSALTDMERTCKRYRFKKAQRPLMCKGEVTEEMPAKRYELGRTIAEGVNAGVF